MLISAGSHLIGKRLIFVTRCRAKSWTEKIISKRLESKRKEQANNEQKKRNNELISRQKTTLPGESADVAVYVEYIQKLKSKPGMASKIEEETNKTTLRWNLFSIFVSFCAFITFIEEMDYVGRLIQNPGSVSEAKKRHGPVLIDPSQRIYWSTPTKRLFDLQGYFVETDDEMPKIGDKVLLRQKIHSPTEESYRLSGDNFPMKLGFIRNKKCVLVVVATAGDKMLLDDQVSFIPEDYVWIESFRPYDRLNWSSVHSLVNHLRWIFLPNTNPDKTVDEQENISFQKFFSHEMRTSSDFGLVPIEYLKRVKSFHKFGDENNYLPPLEMFDNDKNLNKMDEYKKMHMSENNIKMFNTFLTTHGTELLATMRVLFPERCWDQNGDYEIIQNRRPREVPLRYPKKNNREQFQDSNDLDLEVDEEVFKQDMSKILSRL